MTDAEKVYQQINSFIDNPDEKTLLLRGTAEYEKHRLILRAFNQKDKSKGLIHLLHTTMDGMKNFFDWAELYDVKVPKSYGKPMQLSNLTIYFNNLTTKGITYKYDRYEFDFMIIWPIQSVTENIEEIEMLKQLASRQKTKKIIFLSLHEPNYNPDKFEEFVDKVIRID